MNNFENIYLDIISESSLPDFSKIKYKFSLKPGPGAEDFKSFITVLKDEFKSSDEMTLENLYDLISEGDYDDDGEETKGSNNQSGNQPSNENGNSQQPKDETSKSSESSSSSSDDSEKSSSSTDQNSQK